MGKKATGKPFKVVVSPNSWRGLYKTKKAALAHAKKAIHIKVRRVKRL
jgi:hypothetical protein